jgi:hypothetical protein
VTQITALVKKNRKAFDSFAMALQALGAEAMRASDAKDVMLLMDIGAAWKVSARVAIKPFGIPRRSPLFANRQISRAAILGRRSEARAPARQPAVVNSTLTFSLPSPLMGEGRDGLRRNDGGRWRARENRGPLALREF